MKNERRSETDIHPEQRNMYLSLAALTVSLLVAMRDVLGPVQAHLVRVIDRGGRIVAAESQAMYREAASEAARRVVVAICK